jgi:E3 ubiquitin-protein ligase CHFR
MAPASPLATTCGFCSATFCGLSVPGRCTAASLFAAQPHGFTDVADLLQSSEVYDTFDGNSVEVDFLLDFLQSARITPRDIYREVCTTYLPHHGVEVTRH